MRRISLSLTVIFFTCCLLFAKDVAKWDFSEFDGSSIKDSVNSFESKPVSRGDKESINIRRRGEVLYLNNSEDEKDRNDSFLIVDDNDVLTGHDNDGDGFDSLVIEIDIKPNVLKQAQLVRKTDGATDIGYELWMMKDGRVGFSVSSRKGKLGRVISKYKIEAGKWHRIVAVWDGMYEMYNMQVHIDGYIAWGGGIHSIHLSNTDSPMSIGGLYRGENNYGQFFSGAIKNVAISHSRPELLNVSGKLDPVEVIPTGKHLLKQPALIESRFIYETPPTPECHASTVVDLGNGKIAAAWFGGTHEGHTDVGIWFSKYDGTEWTKPRCLAQSPIHNKVSHISMFNPALIKLSDGELLLFYKEGWLEHMEARLITSDDDGETWSQPRYYKPGYIGPGKNKPIELEDGSILSTTGSRIGTYSDTYDLESVIEIENPENFEGIIQGTFLNHGNGKLQTIFRTMREKKLVQSFSYDNGKSWTPFSLTELPSNNSGLDGVTLKDGRHLLIYNHVVTPEGRWGGPRSPLNLAISDDGINWKQVLVLEDEPGEYSYPAIIQADDGMVHITYTWNRLRAKWAKVDPAKLAAGNEGKPESVIPVPRSDASWWRPRLQEKIELNKQLNPQLIFIGDSITHWWEKYGTETWKKYYGKYNAANFGYGGDQTQHVLWRIDNGEIDNINPKLAVLMIGTNNTNYEDQTPEDIAEGIKTIISRIKEKLPETKILLLAIFPRGDYEQRRDKDSNATPNKYWNKNEKVNSIISKFSDDKAVYFLNINESFLNSDGVLTRDVMPDLLHPQQKGYQLWAKAMQPTIEKLIAD